MSGDIKRHRIDLLIKHKNRVVKQSYENIKGAF